MSCAAVTVVCSRRSPDALLMHAKLFLAKHVLENFEMKPIAEEEEEEEEKVEVAQVPVAKPKPPEPLQKRSGTAAAARCRPPAPQPAGLKWLKCCRTEAALFAVVLMPLKSQGSFCRCAGPCRCNPRVFPTRVCLCVKREWSVVWWLGCVLELMASVCDGLLTLPGHRP